MKFTKPKEDKMDNESKAAVEAVEAAEVKAKETKLDLLKFCTSEGGRFNLDKPWLLDDATLCATNVIILIRCRRELYDGEISTEGKHPKIEPIIAPIDDVLQWFTLPDYGKCSGCDGFGEYEKDCENCGGTGWCSCGCGHEHQCGHCEGSKIQHDVCGCKIPFANRSVARRVANRLLLLPNVKWGVVSEEADDHVFFRFDGGDGVFMPLAKEAE